MKIAIVGAALVLLAARPARADECACNDDCTLDGGACAYCVSGGTCEIDCAGDPETDGIPCDPDAGILPLHRVYRTGGCGCDVGGGGLAGAAIVVLAFVRRRYPSSPSQS